MARTSLRRLPLFVGLLLGASAALLLVTPLHCEAPPENIEPIINLQTRYVGTRQANQPAIIRPRFFSTELEIKEKLLAVALGEPHSLPTFGAALNHTLGSHVTKLIFYVCASSPTQDRVKLRPNVVHVSSGCNSLLYHVLSHLAARQFVKDYDFVLITRDSSFIRGENLMSLVNHISVAQEVYMGLPVSTDPRVCELEAGILFSRPTIEKVLANLEQCASTDLASLGDEDVTDCISQLAGFPCQTALGQGRYLSVDAERRFSSALFNDSQSPIISVAPLTSHTSFYRLNHYLDGQTSRKVRRQLQGISNAIADVNSKCDMPDNVWPRGVRSHFKPKKRFDIIRTTYFNRTHVLWPEDSRVALTLDDISMKDVDEVVRACEKLVQSTVELVDGWKTVDPAAGVRYTVDARIRGAMRRLEVVRPLSLTELVAMPYVTEEARITLVLWVHMHEVEEVQTFLDHYASLMKKGERTTLLLVFLLQRNGSEKVFDPIRSAAENYSKQFGKTPSRIAVIKIRCPKHLPEFGLVDIIASKLKKNDIILLIQPNVLLSANFLNRVRMNTIRSEQAFLPIPFAMFNPRISKITQSMSLSKDAGFFDEDSVDILSVYAGDYLEVRRTLAHIPLATVSADLDREAYRNSTFGIAELLLLCKQLHVMRAADPEVRLKYVRRDCDRISSNLREISHCYRSRKKKLGSKKQLAALLAPP
ncbi:chondroitin sulfate synthase 2-like [Varroa destructor]|uniref:Hexosyltransferase n=1 Tax=Varroa destructor TaxID=109461 RepID=A0A7M7K1X1_VARDE|nr:chondroitin sulfate synthase 2-like [Varroa destructor]XP_022659126.1 chondroitin sulfate synthase 2-like [Varroa destructor]XP_022659127.1 chondroitin sulfate synthase 2-like [Varroa destructor]